MLMYLCTLLCPQVVLDVSPATCHNNIVKQTMVDSSCRILTSDIFQDCNKLVRALWKEGGWVEGLAHDSWVLRFSCAHD